MNLDQFFFFLSGGALFLGLFLTLFLVTQEGRAARSQQILGLLILACALNAAHPSLIRAFVFHPAHSFQLFEPLQFLLAPLMTAYASALLRGEFEVRPAHLLHFLPFFAASTVAVVFTLHRTPSSWISLMLWGFLSVQMGSYLVPALGILRRYQSSLKERVSNLERVDSNWLRWFFIVAVGLCLLSGAVLFLLAHRIPPLFLSRGVSLTMTTAVWILGYRGLSQKIPETPEAPEVLEAQGPFPVEEVLSSDPDVSWIKEALIRILETQKPYLEPELGLADLARLLEVPRNQLSAVINQELGLNFYDLVNGYRVKEFRSLLADPVRRREKLLALAFDAGFNSKPTFNKVVLKHTGKTPSQLRQEEIRSQQSP